MRVIAESTKVADENLDPPYARDPRWLLMERILATPDFVRSPRLTDFLRYVCKLTLEERSDAISEQHLGAVVFGRPADYDSSADTIVRSHALRLRRKLEQYFQRTGRSEPLRLVIPRGAYVPLFLPANESEEGIPRLEKVTSPGTLLSPAKLSETASYFGEPLTPLPVAEGRVALRRYRIVLAASLLVSTLLAIGWGTSLHYARRAQTRKDRNHPLWGKLFTTDQPTQIVLGDSGLVLFHNFARKYVSLQDYVDGNLSKQMPYVQHIEPKEALFLSGRRYTSFVDAATLSRLLRMPEATPERTLVRFSRDMRPDDFKSGNIIMIGAQEANPWVELFERSMDFVFTIDTPGQKSAYLNRHPRAEELSMYGPATQETGSKVYAVIAFLPNLSGKGNVLLLEGISMVGTEAAVDLAMDDQQLLPLLRQIRKPDGSLPHFEMLLETNNLKDSAGIARVVTVHIHSS